jgi:hypothetical protein
MRNKFGYLGDANTDGHSFGDPGTGEVRLCGVCGTKCVVERNVNGPTSWAGAMAGHKRLHDVFKCPHYDFEWHKTAYRLAKEMVATASKRLRALIEADLDELVAENLKPRCSKCGLVFDPGCEQVCPSCGSQECTAYKPWIRGCNSQEPCQHRPNCEWVEKKPGG